MAGKGPVRGFPPAPGQPPPVYPPGQFSAWNRAARPADDGYLDTGQAGDAWSGAGYGYAARGAPGAAGPWDRDAGYAGPGHGEPGPSRPGYGDHGYGDHGYGDHGYGDHGYGEPGYSVLAVSDPAADVTSTQSWEVVDASPAASRWADPRAPAEGVRTAVPSPRGPGPRAPVPGPRAPAADPPPADRREAGNTGQDGATAPQGWAGQARSQQTGQGSRGRPDTGGHRHQPPRPRSAAQAGQPGRQPAPPRSQAPRADRPHSRSAHARTRTGKRTGRVLLACGLVLALAAGAAAYLRLSGGHQAADPAAAAPRSAEPVQQSQSATPTATPALGRWGHIETRRADPLALTLAELFPARFSAAGSTYSRTVQRDGTRCTKAVIGAALQSAVRKGKCTQVMRASYLSGSRKLMGTIGVLNLVSVVAAERSGKAAGGRDFIGQLPAATGPTHHLTKGTGLEETEIKGHYLVLVWAEFASLHPPKTKAQRLELGAFCNRLIQNTANLSLASRMITGKPRTP
jgi:hypothetical protein